MRTLLEVGSNLKAFKSFRCGWLILSLIGMGISAIMFFVPAELYEHSQDHDAPALTQAMWFLLFILAFLGMVVAAIMYTYRTDEESKPLVNRH